MLAAGRACVAVQTRITLRPGLAVCMENGESHLSFSLCLEYLVKISPGEGEGGRAARHPSQVFYFVITEERSQAADSALPPATLEQY